MKRGARVVGRAAAWLLIGAGAFAAAAALTLCVLTISAMMDQCPDGADCADARGATVVAAGIGLIGLV